MLLQPFLEQCRRRPQALALAEGERRLGYGELLARAQALAAALQAVGVAPGRPVAVHLPRGIDAVIAVFGTLLAGACYVPLDTKNPAARLAFILADAQAAAVLGLGQPPAGVEDKRWIDLETIAPAAPQPVETPAESLAAILYTSGSTGQPRGVALSHGAIAAFAGWAADLVQLSEADRIAGSTPFFFDLSTFDLYAVLGRGASLHFLPAALTLAPARLAAWLQTEAISGWYTVPSLLAFLAYKGNLGEIDLASLRFVLFAGEVFPTPALMELAGRWPHATLYNLFGPTETNVCCHWPVIHERLDPAESIPIGLPAAGCRLHVEPASGELWVQGPTLASGYWSGGALRPFLNDEGWYATGDRVSFQQGEYRFHGRLGRMLKCSGYRVEPAEIEACVLALPGVRSCAVVGLDDPAAGQRPALALCLEPQVALAHIRQALARQLPAYMQPSRYLVLEDLPRLANGKLDYQGLRALLEAHA
ncbi:AMP-binding protein [Methylogaea oryzae]|uniref:D-alanine--poly(Phosphoribitol) ligase n=1 Tax=Methylogaea oryzae TaxID=1295382 RepID=A0A8D4VPU3_9GAMM|nr:AMP-binding protein [Methylogaea oryzae]BBL71838.1 D-alanine--poly(phosphoribitol) ligase [Methylogaea oryzae]